MNAPRAVALCLTLLAPAAAAGQDAFARDLVVNGGLEVDDYNTRGEVMSCPVRARVTYGQRDGLP